MPIDVKLNLILKEMWRLNEKEKNKEPLNNNEKQFYDAHLQTIRDYYRSNAKHWNKQREYSRIFDNT